MYWPYVVLGIAVLGTVAFWFIGRWESGVAKTMIQSADQMPATAIEPANIEFIARTKRVADAALAAAATEMLKQFKDMPTDVLMKSKAVPLALTYALSDAMQIDAASRRTSVAETFESVGQTILMLLSGKLIVTDSGRRGNSL